MDAVDEYIPDPQRALDKPFSMSVEDVFSIQGRGTVVTGRIEQGIVRTGDSVSILGINDAPLTSTVTGAWCALGAAALAALACQLSCVACRAPPSGVSVAVVPAAAVRRRGDVQEDAE